jgi:hypothetical protein
MRDLRVFEFLQYLACHPDDLVRLRHLPKSDVLAFASAKDFQIIESVFDETLWQAEIAIAARIGEPFDFSCSMWETMWGKYYLDYLVQNVAAVMRPNLLAANSLAASSDALPQTTEK